MNKQIERQMCIIEAPCWKCEDMMNVAVIINDIKITNIFRGPEAFSQEEKEIAKKHNVIIRERYSYTRVETYSANTCPHCDTFIGKFYLYEEYFEPAAYGVYKHMLIDLI